MKRWLFMATVIGFALPASAARAENEPDAEAPPGDEEKALLRLAKEHVRGFELHDGDGQKIALLERPLLAFSDSARRHSHGTFWAWGDSGRPAAFMELWTQDNWVHAVTLTSKHQVVLTAPDGRQWQPPQVPPETKPIASAPIPAEKVAARLRQIKDLARRFTAHEFWDPNNSRFELRLLVQPVHRYSDPEAGIQDGATFLFANGTNPETLLLIEALGPSRDESRWHYCLARSSHAETHVELDGREVWKCERAGPASMGPTRTYWLFTSPIETANVVDPFKAEVPGGRQ